MINIHGAFTNKSTKWPDEMIYAIRHVDIKYLVLY